MTETIDTAAAERITEMLIEKSRLIEKSKLSEKQEQAFKDSDKVAALINELGVEAVETILNDEPVRVFGVCGKDLPKIELKMGIGSVIFLNDVQGVNVDAQVDHAENMAFDIGGGKTATVPGLSDNEKKPVIALGSFSNGLIIGSDIHIAKNVNSGNVVATGNVSIGGSVLGTNDDKSRIHSKKGDVSIGGNVDGAEVKNPEGTLTVAGKITNSAYDPDKADIQKQNIKEVPPTKITSPREILSSILKVLGTLVGKGK